MPSVELLNSIKTALVYTRINYTYEFILVKPIALMNALCPIVPIPKAASRTSVHFVLVQEGF